MSSEEWRPIPCSTYSISSRGRVRNDRNGNILTGSSDKDGYHRVNLKLSVGMKTIRVHRLVALAFIGDHPAGKTQVAHKDGSKSNNEVSNLRWSDALENNREKAVHGTQNRGVTQHLCRLTEEKVRRIREAASRGISQRRIASAFGISKGNVQYIVHGRTWKHVA